MYTLAGFGYTNVSFETDSQMLTKMQSGEEEILPRMKPHHTRDYHPIIGKRRI